MSNKETLQSYNEELTKNGITIEEILQTVNSLPVYKEIVLQDKSIEVTENGIQTIIADEGYDGLNNVSVTTNVESSGTAGELQSKSITITERGTNTIVPDEGYYGLEKIIIDNQTPSIQNIVYRNSCIGGEAAVTLENSVEAIKGLYVLAIIASRCPITISDGWQLLYSNNTSNPGQGTINQYTYIYSKIAEGDIESCTVTGEKSDRLFNYMLSLNKAGISLEVEELLNITSDSSASLKTFTFSDMKMNDLLVCNSIYTDPSYNYEFSNSTSTNAEFTTQDSVKRLAIYEHLDFKNKCDIYSRSSFGGKLFTRIRPVDIPMDEPEIPSIKDCQYLFNGGYRNNEIETLIACCTGATNMANMFRLSNITSAVTGFSNFKNDNIISTEAMFLSCSGIPAIDFTPNTRIRSNKTSSMFSGCTKVTKLDLSGFDFSAVTNTYSMFNNCKLLEELDISSWDFSKVTAFGTMFANCGSSLTDGKLTTVYVKDETAQAWVLNSGTGRPDTWSAANVIIKS